MSYGFLAVMLTINHISFLRTKKVPYERAKYFFNPGLIIKCMTGRGIPDRFNLLHIFSYTGRSPSMMEIVENSVTAILTESLAC